MADETVPPLTRAALDNLPAVLQDMVQYWTVLKQAATTILQRLKGFDPERLPASQLAQWVEEQLLILQHLLNAIGELGQNLLSLQEDVPDPAFLERVINTIEDEAAPTD